MNESLLTTLFNLLIILAIFAALFGIWFIIWSMIRHPIRMKDDILKERDEARKELTEIQAAKGVEWDQYKKQTDELERIRKAYFSTKNDLDKMKEELASVKVQKDRLVDVNRELKKPKKETNKSKK
jgi:uncharacterized protein (DUF3084 family)